MKKSLINLVTAAFLLIAVKPANAETKIEELSTFSVEKVLTQKKQNRQLQNQDDFFSSAGQKSTQGQGVGDFTIGNFSSKTTENNTWGKPVTETDNQQVRATIPCSFWSGVSYYNLQPLMKEDGDYQAGEATFNFCTYPLDPFATVVSQKTFAFVQKSGSLISTPMTGDSMNFPDSTSFDDNGDIVLSLKSDFLCPTDKNRTTSFQATVRCNESNYEDGKAYVEFIDYKTDPCTLNVTVSHVAGCRGSETKALSEMFATYPWATATFFSIFGIIALPLMLISILICRILGLCF